MSGTETIEWTAIIATTDISEAMQNLTSPSIYWENYISDRFCTYTVYRYVKWIRTNKNTKSVFDCVLWSLVKSRLHFRGIYWKSIIFLKHLKDTLPCRHTFPILLKESKTIKKNIYIKTLHVTKPAKVPCQPEYIPNAVVITEKRKSLVSQVVSNLNICI